VFITVKDSGIPALIIAVDEFQITSFGNSKKSTIYIKIDDAIAWYEREAAINGQEGKKRRRDELLANRDVLSAARAQYVKQASSTPDDIPKAHPTSIRLATQADLPAVETWLAAELAETGEGFYHNWTAIQRGTEEKQTFLMWRDGQAVAVLVDGIVGPDILTVRPDLRGLGLGGEFARWLIERALNRNYSVLEIECAPRTSISFWKKHGFLPRSASRAYRLLERSLAVSDGPDVPVTVSLFPESKNWKPDTSAHWVRAVDGRRHDWGVQLPVRVALYAPDAAALKDCVARIVVDGSCVYEDKLKRPKASGAGIQRDPGGFYYIERVLTAATSPVAAWMRDRCEMAPEWQVDCTEAYRDFVEWRVRNGDGGEFSLTRFGTDLRAASGNVRRVSARGVPSGKVYRGFRLTTLE
jgi:GNAT superfamily N-acetyltransferase